MVMVKSYILITDFGKEVGKVGRVQVCYEGEH